MFLHEYYVTKVLWANFLLNDARPNFFLCSPTRERLGFTKLTELSYRGVWTEMFPPFWSDMLKALEGNAESFGTIFSCPSWIQQDNSE